MNKTIFEAGSLNTLETRSAYAGESLYALLKRDEKVTKAVSSFHTALESHAFSEKEQRVLWSCLKVMHNQPTVALEDFDLPGDAGGGDSSGFVNKVGNVLSSIVSASKDKIVQAGGFLKKELQDFYDARLNWYGALDKELTKLQPQIHTLDGAAFANAAAVSELGRKKSNRTYPTPTHRVSVAQQEAVKALMVADLIKNQSANVAKALIADERALERAVNELLKTIRSTARQEGDVCHWRWDSFTGEVTASFPRSANYSNLTANDFGIKQVAVETSNNPCVPERLKRATEYEYPTAQKHAASAQKTIEAAMGKNNVDVWQAIANLRVDEEGQGPDQNKIHGVTSLILFADKIHEYIAKMAQQSYFDSVFTLVKWMDLSLKDMAREQSRQAQ